MFPPIELPAGQTFCGMLDGYPVSTRMGLGTAHSSVAPTVFFTDFIVFGGNQPMADRLLGAALTLVDVALPVHHIANRIGNEVIDGGWQSMNRVAHQLLSDFGTAALRAEDVLEAMPTAYAVPNSDFTIAHLSKKKAALRPYFTVRLVDVGGRVRERRYRWFIRPTAAQIMSAAFGRRATSD